MVQKLIGRGVLAGAVAGMLAFIFARIFAEPLIQKAIDYESARDAAIDALDKLAGKPVAAAGPDIFSRTIQANVGIGLGMVAFGAAMGAIFATVYIICLGRSGQLKARTIALLVGAGGFLSMYLVPFIKYPANPPSIGHEETIKTRGGLYVAMVICSVIFLVAAVNIGKRLAVRYGNWNATILGALCFVLACGIVMAILPQVGHLAPNVAAYGRHSTETPLPLVDAHGKIVYPGFPADVLFNFRFCSVAAQLIMWMGIAVVFGPMADRVLKQAVPEGADEGTPALV